MVFEVFDWCHGRQSIKCMVFEVFDSKVFDSNVFDSNDDSTMSLLCTMQG